MEKYNLSQYRILEYVGEIQEGMIVTLSLDGDREYTEDGMCPIGFPTGRTVKVRVHLQQPDGSRPDHPGSCVCESCHPQWVGYPTDDPGIINTMPHPVAFQSSKSEALHFFDFKDGYHGAERCAICGAWVDEADSVECRPEVYILPPYRSDGIIYAKAIEELVRTYPGGAELVFTRFDVSANAEGRLLRIEKQNPGAIIVGSTAAAQAFPGRVLAMVPVEGFEKVPPSEKRMRDDKFITF